MDLLPDGEGLSTVGLLFMTLVYGYILLTAAEQIGHGSDLLLTVFGPGIVGGLVIPILGAIPDGMIILFSGLSGGTQDEMMAQLQIGLGTLAGSTVGLLTLPWAGVVLLGWRDLDPNGGTAMYKDVDGIKVPKADESFSLWYSGVVVTKSTASSVWVMLATSLCYLIIQIPAAIWSSFTNEKQAQYEHIPALIGLIVSLLALIGYCIWQLKSSTAEENLQRKSEECRIKRWQQHFGRTFGRFDNVVREIFCRMDLDNNGNLDPNELATGLRLLGMPVSDNDLVKRVVKTMDLDGDGKVGLAEFRKAVKLWMYPYKTKSNRRLSNCNQNRLSSHRGSLSQTEFQRPGGTDESHVLEFMKKRLAEKNPLLGENDHYHDEVEVVKVSEAPDRYTFWKACIHLGAGMALVLLFADPMVSILSNLASQIGVGAFYVSFVVTPLASNASEMLSALYFAKSKTVAKVSMAHASLYGAACMNNTFCLAVFFFIIYKNNLPWEFTAETMCILLCEILIALLGYKRTIPAWKAVIALLLYPLALLFVIVWTKLK